ncbi:uncharacterized protein LOC131046547 [Cryptomeria japonica]|uniref:uncharacterized protein LOC131046547 n=1 Tax=Cryptomeria japonica TaxID=3369 RepID=UPI0025AD8398|nr:uncharacterized protein LOC131046547 [Cryptomeria japonica]
MQKASSIKGFSSLVQSKNNLVDREGSWNVRGGSSARFADLGFISSKHRKVRYSHGKNLNKVLGRKCITGLRCTGNDRLRLGQSCKKQDVEGHAVSDSKDENGISHNSIVSQEDLQSEISGGSHSSPVENLRPRTEGMVFGLGQPGSWDSMEVGCPVVRRYLGDNEQRWYMWYYGRKKGSRDSVGLTVSANGIHWQRGTGRIETDDDVGIVMECSEDWWAFDTEIVRPSDILILSSEKLKASSGVYWMYYSGCNADEINVPQVLLGNPWMFEETGLESTLFRSLPGLAMSPDGRNWARIEGDHHSGALFDAGTEGEWDSLSVGSPQVVFHSPDDLRMYYHSLDVKSGCFAVGVARSRDGVKWVKLGKILEGGPPGSFDEIGITARQVISNQNGHGYMMIYEGVAADGTRSIGLARSSDGLKNWIRCQNEPVFRPATSSNSWDNRGVGSPCLVQMDENEWRLYYQGVGSAGRSGIGLAISTDGSLTNFQRWHGFHV